MSSMLFQELLKETGMNLWVTAQSEFESESESESESKQAAEPVEILSLESALHLPRVKILCIFPEDLMRYWLKVQKLFLNIVRAFNLEKFEYAVLFGEELVLNSLLENVCRRTSARKIVSFGVDLQEKPQVAWLTLVTLTQNLEAVWADPVKKRQVWTDVSSILL